MSNQCLTPINPIAAETCSFNKGMISRIAFIPLYLADGSVNSYPIAGFSFEPSGTTPNWHISQNKQNIAERGQFLYQKLHNQVPKQADTVVETYEDNTKKALRENIGGFTVFIPDANSKLIGQLESFTSGYGIVYLDTYDNFTFLTDAETKSKVLPFPVSLVQASQVYGEATKGNGIELKVSFDFINWSLLLMIPAKTANVNVLNWIQLKQLKASDITYATDGIVVLNGGESYTDGDTISLSGGTGLSATVAVTAGAITGFKTVTTAGYGYSIGVSNVTGGNGTGAVVYIQQVSESSTPTLDGIPAVSTVTLTVKDYTTSAKITGIADYLKNSLSFTKVGSLASFDAISCVETETDGVYRVGVGTKLDLPTATAFTYNAVFESIFDKPNTEFYDIYDKFIFSFTNANHAANILPSDMLLVYSYASLKHSLTFLGGTSGLVNDTVYDVTDTDGGTLGTVKVKTATSPRIDEVITAGSDYRTGAVGKEITDGITSWGIAINAVNGSITGTNYRVGSLVNGSILFFLNTGSTPAVGLASTLQSKMTFTRAGINLTDFVIQERVEKIPAQPGYYLAVFTSTVFETGDVIVCSFTDNSGYYYDFTFTVTIA